MKPTLILISALLLFQINPVAQIYVGDTEVDTTTIIKGLDIPWEIQWGPDDHIWCTERYGRVSRINPESGDQDVILNISDLVYQSGESGLLGMVLHPDFENNPYVYMAYTYSPSGQIIEKVVRYTYENGKLQNELVLIDNIQGNTTHDGCRMLILPDETLLFTTGDAQFQDAPQNLNHLSGKTIRINLDGSIPDDNPFEGNPVYSFGHRNAQGLCLGPNGIIYSSEHGPNTDDELNILVSGRNYGWPNVRGYCDTPSEQTFCEENDVKEPIRAWTPTVAASDIVYYTHPSIPEWQNHVLMTSLKNKRVYDMEMDDWGSSIVSEKQFFTNWWGRLRDICIGPDGAVYLATSGQTWQNTKPFTHGIVKIWNPDFVTSNPQITDGKTTIRIYPNPASDNIHVLLPANNKSYQLYLYSAKGELLSQKRLTNSSESISLDNLKTGFLMALIRMDGEIIHTEKLFITKD